VELLRKLIGDLSRDGRSTRSASVKPALVALSAGAFDEKALGFSSFRAFLEHAAQLGSVRLVKAETGPDVDVVPNLDPESVGEPDHRIRQDIWNAFVAWPDSTKRYWDKNSQLVQIFRVDGDIPQEGFVEIEPIKRATVQQWMEIFAANTQGVKGEALRAALADAKPFQAFVEAAGKQGLLHGWRQSHRSQVEAVIAKWLADNQLSIDLYDMTVQPWADSARSSAVSRSSRRKVVRAFEQEAVAPGQGVPDGDDLRRRVHDLVDQMTTPELLSLSVPLRLVLS
jgi:hypothetical protein